MKTAILVLDMYGDSVSLVTELLYSLGVVDEKSSHGGSEDKKILIGNPKILSLNEKIISENSMFIDDVNFDFSIKKELLHGYVQEAKEVMDEIFFERGLFFIKDKRLCLTLLVWEEALKQSNIDVKIVLPYENPLVSMKIQKNIEKYSAEKSLLLWIKYFYQAEYLSRHYNRVFVNFDATGRNLKKQIMRLVDFLGYEKSSQSDIENFIKSCPKHKAVLLKNHKESLPLFMQEVMLLGEQSGFDTLSLERLDYYRQQYIAMTQIFYNADFSISLESAKKSAKNTKRSKFEKNAEQKSALIQELQEQLDILNATLFEKQNENNQLRVNQDEMLNDLENVKELLNSDIRKKQQELEQNIQIIQELQTQKAELETRMADISQELQVAVKNLEQTQKERETLFEQNAQKQQEIESLNADLDELISDLENIKEMFGDDVAYKQQEIEQNRQTIQTLQTQKAEIENNYAQKLQEIEILSKNLEQKQQEKEALLEQNSQKQQEIEQNRQTIQTLETQKAEVENGYAKKLHEAEELGKKLEETNSTLSITIEANAQQKADLEAQIVARDQELQAAAQNIEQMHKERAALSEQNTILEAQRAEIEKSYAQKIVELNANIDVIVNDLASIKESKCWIYTKPIRDLQKVMKK